MRQTHEFYITSSLKAYEYLRPLTRMDVEEFWIVGLNSTKRIIDSQLLFRGTVDSCPVHPRDIIRFACIQNCSSVLVAHNHPSNDIHPSPSDIRVTKKMQRACKLVEIPLVDHIIIGVKDYYSFRDQEVHWTQWPRL